MNNAVAERRHGFVLADRSRRPWSSICAGFRKIARNLLGDHRIITGCERQEHVGAHLVVGQRHVAGQNSSGAA